MKLIRKENDDYHLVINNDIKSLQEFNITKEDCDILTLGYNVEKMADEFYKNYQSRPYAMEKGAWRQGFKAHQKLTKDKLHEILSNFYFFVTNGEVCKHEIINEFLFPPTEWNVKFNEQGKLELL